MLQNICGYIHNLFIYKTLVGEFQIQNGVISPSFPLLEGQRFLIHQSAMNDGIYTYHETGVTNDDDTEAAGLTDETFTGEVCALAVPKELLSIVQKINETEADAGEDLYSPFQSENMGSYSYSKAGAVSAEGGVPWWANVYGGILDRWRRIAL